VVYRLKVAEKRRWVMKILVIFYPLYGHVRKMAEAVTPQ